MTPRRLKQIDVFTTTPLAGNPAAVVLDAVGLETARMQAIAREMNLSETTFVLPPTRPEADYHVRIFTPRSELPFAGHPTIATAAALVEDGRLPAEGLVRQECGIGIVPIVVEPRAGGPFFLMTQATPSWTPSGLTRERCGAMLGCRADDVLDLPVEVVSTGVPWIIVPLRALTVARALQPNLALVEAVSRERETAGVTVFCLGAERPGCALHARSFAPHHGVPEDPVCGSGNGSIAAYVARHGLLPGRVIAYTAEQGLEVARPGEVTVRAAADERGGWVIQVGGQAVTVLEGSLVA